MKNHCIAALIITTASLSSKAAAQLSAVGTASMFPAVGRETSFVVNFKVVGAAGQGVQFHPAVRVLLEDQTWVCAATGCFPTGVTGNNTTGGDIRCFGKIPEDKVVKSIQLVARLGNPNVLFWGGKDAKSAGCLDDASLEALFKEGGVLLEIPVTTAK